VKFHRIPVVPESTHIAVTMSLLVPLVQGRNPFLAEGVLVDCVHRLRGIDVPLRFVLYISTWGTRGQRPVGGDKDPRVSGAETDHGH
jgi:hypothetical protein